MLQPGERAGYDLRFTARRETRLAVLSIGYADGLPGACPAAWVQCCSMAVVRPSWAASVWIRLWWTPRRSPETAPGDEAVLIGNSGAEKITACDVAEAAGDNLQ